MRTQSMSPDAKQARMLCDITGNKAVKGKRMSRKHWLKVDGTAYCRTPKPYVRRALTPERKAQYRLGGFRRRHGRGPSLHMSMLPAPYKRLMRKAPRAAGLDLLLKAALPRKPRKTIMKEPMMSEAAIANLIARAAATQRPSPNPLALLAGIAPSPRRPSPSPAMVLNMPSSPLTMMSPRTSLTPKSASPRMNFGAKSASPRMNFGAKSASPKVVRTIPLGLKQVLVGQKFRTPHGVYKKTSGKQYNKLY